MQLPSLTVTSFIRNEGSHATGLAVDIALHNYPSDWQQKIRLYFSVYLFLIDNIDKPAKIWLAYPDDCLHYHLDFNYDSKNYAIENTVFENNECRYGGLIFQTNDRQSIRNELGNLYLTMFGKQFVPIEIEGGIRFDDFLLHRLPSNQKEMFYEFAGKYIINDFRNLFELIIDNVLEYIGAPFMPRGYALIIVVIISVLIYFSVFKKDGYDPFKKVFT